MINIPEEERCPTCGAELPAGATECPECGEKLPAAAEETAAAPSEEQPKEEAVTETEAPAEEPAGERSPMMFWLGVILAIVGFLGGPIISWAHDAFKWEIIGKNFDAFGWLNMTVAVIGIVIGIVGVVMMLMGMKKSAPSGEAKEEEKTEEKTE
ncbi:MAG: zinc ribbon domain-containing protein [Thermoplasmata archaeon]|nr:zinc ribbon domain-containing protein [Thermoplasmata archaeon]